MPADFDGKTCPRCGASTLATPEGERYCSNIGGGSVSACSWGLGAYDRGSREADRAAWRGIPEPCPQNHPAACIRDGACAWCADIAALAEANALLALYSGGRAGAVPEGWRVVPGPALLHERGDGRVSVYPDGVWIAWAANGDVEAGGNNEGPVLTACAEALAWLKAQEVTRAR